MKATKANKKKVLTALEQSLGVVTQALKKINIHRSTFYRWLQEDEEFAKEVAEVQDITLDFAEAQLLKQIQGGNTTATIFYLKTKGKERGYIERQELEHSGELKEIKVEIKGNEQS
jgi:hypothetical protein